MYEKAFFESLNNSIKECFLPKSSSGLDQREDSRAFGASIEGIIKQAWETICQDLSMDCFPLPGKRTIYDFAAKYNKTLFGFDVKTKDIGKGKYSDGGVCSLANLFRFLVNQKGIFVIVEVAHYPSEKHPSKRIIKFINTIPLHVIPVRFMRIENLGIGQLRLNEGTNVLIEHIDWNKSLNDFFKEFVPLVTEHFETVSQKATDRIKAIDDFKESGFTNFKMT